MCCWTPVWHYWVPFGHSWTPLGTIWAPFGHQPTAFRHHYTPVGDRWASPGTRWAPLGSIGHCWVPPGNTGHHSGTVGFYWAPLGSIGHRWAPPGTISTTSTPRGNPHRKHREALNPQSVGGVRVYPPHGPTAALQHHIPARSALRSITAVTSLPSSPTPGGGCSPTPRSWPWVTCCGAAGSARSRTSARPSPAWRRLSSR